MDEVGVGEGRCRNGGGAEWVVGLGRLDSRVHWSEKSSVWDISHAIPMCQRTLSWQQQAGCLIEIGQKTTKSVIVTIQSLRCLVSLFKHNLKTYLLPLTVNSSLVLPPRTTSPHDPFGCGGLMNHAVQTWRRWGTFSSPSYEQHNTGPVKSSALLQKERCSDKFCQRVDLSGRSTVSAFSVINFSAVSRFLSPLIKLLWIRSNYTVEAAQKMGIVSMVRPNGIISEFLVRRELAALWKWDYVFQRYTVTAGWSSLITGLPFLIKKSVNASLIIQQITVAQILIILSLPLCTEFDFSFLFSFTSVAPIRRHEGSNTLLFRVKVC